MFYNGPITDPQSADDPTDFILLELIGGRPVMTIDLGSGSSTLEIPKATQLNDGQWHKLDIFRTGQVRLRILKCVLTLTAPATKFYYSKSASVDAFSARIKLLSSFVAYKRGANS